MLQMKNLSEINIKSGKILREGVELLKRGKYIYYAKNEKKEIKKEKCKTS